jgi:hypothetical protein
MSQNAMKKSQIITNIPTDPKQVTKVITMRFINLKRSQKVTTAPRDGRPARNHKKSGHSQSVDPRQSSPAHAISRSSRNRGDRSNVLQSAHCVVRIPVGACPLKLAGPELCCAVCILRSAQGAHVHAGSNEVRTDQYVLMRTACPLVSS